METKIVLYNDPLWNRLQRFSLDSPNADFPFSKKLAKEEKWTVNFTKKAIEEYKRFVYLCCILPSGASPSETVDKVWHMHLIYTQNYWEEFCPNILRRKLHHYPSKGGINEKEKHKKWFQDTLINYEKIFQEKAPEEIWFNLKPNLKYRKIGWWSFKILSFISLLFILSSCSCSDAIGNVLSVICIICPLIFLFISFISGISGENSDPKNPNKKDEGGGGFGSCGGSSSCSSSCGSGCGGGGCGGCGGS